MANELFEQVKHEATEYGKAVGKVGKLHLIGVVSRVLGLFLLLFTIVLCVFAVFTFAGVAAIGAMSVSIPVWAASLIVGCAYLLLMAVAILCRKPLFINPFIALLSKQAIGTQEQLALETLKAEHDVELQNVRIETEVENATRELNFYTGLIRHLWHWLTGKLRKS